MTKTDRRDVWTFRPPIPIKRAVERYLQAHPKENRSGLVRKALVHLIPAYFMDQR